mgnify:CR=1 FL=1
MPDIANHSLFNDFPESRDLIHKMKLEDEEFSRKAAQYHDLDHRVRGLEKCSVPTSDQIFEQLKRERMQLKDELYARIKKSHRGAY